jgi:tetratricopeptide (TPR) repeat protein
VLFVPETAAVIPPPTTLPPTTTSLAPPATTPPAPSDWWVSPDFWWIPAGIVGVAVLGFLVVRSVRARAWWHAVVDRLYPIWSAAVVVVLGGLAQAIAAGAGWAEATRTRQQLLGATFLAAMVAAAAQLLYTAKSQQPTSHRRPWNISPPISSFTGRRDELAALQRQLRRRPADGIPPTVVLTGIPGVGKTQLARAYAHRTRRQYRLGWWLTAETATTLDGPLRALAERLGLDPDSPLGTLAEEMHQTLASRRRWLLVFDNADQPAQLAPFLPGNGRGHVLITSRHSRWQQLAEPLRVTPLPADDAVRILLMRTGDHDADAARELVEALHHLPLAVEQAAAYIGSQPDLSIADYLELFRTHEPQLLERGTPLHYQEGRTVATVVAIALQQLGETTTAGQLLRLCAFLAPDRLPLRLLLSRRDGLPVLLADAAADEVVKRDAEEMLYRLGLLTDDAQGTVQLHRLLQDAVRLQLPDDEQHKWAQNAVDVLAELLDADGDVSARDERWTRLLLHVDAACEHALSIGLMSSGLARLLAMVGGYLGKRNQLPAARYYLEQALAMYRRLYGEDDHADIATTLDTLGRVLVDQLDLPAARELYEEALAIWGRLYGDDDRPEVAASLTGLGIVVRDLGELPAARDYLEQALAMRRRLYGDDDRPEVAASLHNLGAVLDHLGERSAARDHFEQALAIWGRLYGDDDRPEVAASLTSLGIVLHELGERSAARDYLEQALSMYRRLYGDDNHSNVALCLNSLGNVLDDLGELQAARNYREQALAMQRRLYGDDDHPDTAASLYNLGNTLRKLGEPSAARDYLEQALSMYRRLYSGNDHPNSASSLNSLGAVLDHLGELPAARELYEEALAMQRRLYGDDDHPDIADSLTNLGGVMRKLGDRPAAASLEAEAEVMKQRLFEQQYPIPPGLKDI